MKKRVLICGAGGFIGGHLASYLLKEKNFEIICADIKPLEFWFQIFDENINYSFDLKSYENCLSVSKNVDYVFNMACNMGGMGFIENNKAECMLSVLINTNLLRASKINNIKKYLFSSSACVYNASKQDKSFVPGLKEEDAYPADPEDGYGWEKLFSERMCRHFFEDFGLETRVVRYHNVYGPYGTYGGGREKAPAALCRKIINAKLNNEVSIEVWGSGTQTRSFMFIDDCIDGTIRVFHDNHKDVFNVGSEQQVSINEMIEIIEKIAGYKVNKNYLLDKPRGVMGRSSDNTLIKKKLGWDYKFSLEEGLKITYNWIYKDIINKNNSKKFIRSY